jgi:hypothetical protein
VKLTIEFAPPPVPWDFETEKPAKATLEHVASLPGAVAGSWGGNRRFFLDAGLLSDEDEIDGQHPLSTVLERCGQQGLLAVPVFGLGRGDSYFEAVGRAVTHDSHGACLRIGADDLEDADELSPAIIDALASLALQPQEVDLLIDLGPILPQQGWTGAAIRLLVSSIPHLGDWRSFTLAASAFPVDLSGVKGESVATLPRTEWAVWRGLHARRERLARLPTFADYGISNPVQREVDPRIIQMSAAIRYTLDEEFLIIKGRSVRLRGFDQYYELAASLASRQDFRGKDFSWGDAYIAECAARTKGPGNAPVWRRVGNSQHMAFVTNQLASLRDA